VFCCLRRKVQIGDNKGFLIRSRLREAKMRSKMLAALAVSSLATIGSPAFAAGAGPTNQFKSLDKIAAVPMSQADLSSVRGAHVHFDDAGGGAEHLAGSFADHDGDGVPDNWAHLDGLDPRPVAPSYHGLCVAQAVGVGGISIPGAQFQC
jgi:hypothetical protein